MRNFPLLNKDILVELSKKEAISMEQLLSLPERIVQFGNGVLLRGLPDFYIDQANKKGIFNGRIVVVKTTGASGSSDDFEQQDYLYTHVIRGIADNQLVDQHLINASISRVLQASDQWSDVLSCAGNPDINILFSNTTEQGLVYLEEKIGSESPSSFPAKLLAYLIHRFESLGNTDISSMVIIPTELIEYNGDVLKSLILKLMAYNDVPSNFHIWFEERVTFCNSLVDRIVPGKPEPTIKSEIEEGLGYEDQYMIMSEPYNLWAIEGHQSLRHILSFIEPNPGIKLTDNIDVYKELKLRLLNATHTFSAGIALMNKLETVTQAMHDEHFLSFVTDLTNDIKESISLNMDKELKDDFAKSVIERFKNPNIKHYWSSIIFSYSEKFKIRCIPLMKLFYQRNGRFSTLMLKGLTAYFYLSIPDFEENGNYYRELGDLKLKLNDPMSSSIFEMKSTLGMESLIRHQIEQYFFSNTDPSIQEVLIKNIIKNLHLEMETNS